MTLLLPYDRTIFLKQGRAIIRNFFLHFLQDHRISNPNDNSGSLAGGENAVALKMQQINREIEDLQRQKKEVQANIAGGASNNAALLQRFRYTLHEISGS